MLKKTPFRIALMGSLVTFFCVHSNTLATTLSFEGLADSTLLTTQYAGVTFTNTIVLSSGISLNEFEFPPHSGFNVVSDDTGPIGVRFATPVADISGYFTYSEPLTLSAFDIHGSLLSSVTSAFANNEGLSGNPGSTPNEYLQLTSVGISQIQIKGDPSGGSFALDDFNFSTAAAAPEPKTFFGAGFGLLILGFAIRRKDPYLTFCKCK